MLTTQFIWLALLTLAQQAPAAIIQQSTGWCSPNIANVTGSVTVNCIGVDPRALKRLNAELREKNLRLEEEIQEANDWAARYKELERELSQLSNDSLSKQAEEYLHAGELERAGAILDQILGDDEGKIDQIAADHYNRALVFELQFLPGKALPHLGKAYQYRPAELAYGENYSGVLCQQNDFARAEPVLLAILNRAVELIKRNPPVYLPVVAAMTNNLANLYSSTQRPELAEAAFKDALTINTALGDSYLPDVAKTLNNLAVHYATTHRVIDAEQDYLKAMRTYYQLIASRPGAYRSNIAEIFNNLGTLYVETRQMEKAKAALEDARVIRAKLAEANPVAYAPDLAATLYNLVY